MVTKIGAWLPKCDRHEVMGSLIQLSRSGSANGDDDYYFGKTLDSIKGIVLIWNGGEYKGGRLWRKHIK